MGVRMRSLRLQGRLMAACCTLRGPCRGLTCAPGPATTRCHAPPPHPTHALGSDAGVVVPVGADGLWGVLGARVLAVHRAGAGVAVGALVHGAAVAELAARRQAGGTRRECGARQRGSGAEGWAGGGSVLPGGGAGLMPAAVRQGSPIAQALVVGGTVAAVIGLCTAQHGPRCVSELRHRGGQAAVWPDPPHASTMQLGAARRLTS